MTTRKAITLGILTSALISILALGFKYNAFDTKITNPNANKHRIAEVRADNIENISNKWLWNTSIPQSTLATLQTQQIEFTSLATKQTFTEIRQNYDQIHERNYLQYKDTNNTYQSFYQVSTQTPNGNWTNFGSKIINFTNKPTGAIYSFLDNNATPVYNGDVLITDSSVITEVRKSNVHLTDTYKGVILQNNGTIQIYIDAGITSLNINGTTYTDYNGAINITNDDIIIKTTGSKTNTTSFVFTINYFNTRPEWINPPYPDPSDNVIEVIPIMDLMFTILGMPFSFITQAFDLTLWEGTPYAFNFKNFILSLIAIATLIFIIKLFTSGFSIIGNYTANRDNREFKRSQTKLNNAKTEQIKKNEPKITHTYIHKDK